MKMGTLWSQENINLQDGEDCLLGSFSKDKNQLKEDLRIGGFLFKQYQWEVFKMGKKMMKSISSFGKSLRWIGDEEAKEEEEENPRQLLTNPPTIIVARKGKVKRMLFLYRKWSQVPLLNKLVGLRTWVFRSRMSLTKKEEMFTKKSNFQKVYISKVSETSKIVSRFCVKRLFCP